MKNEVYLSILIFGAYWTGPGKGMYSRFYTNILNMHSWAFTVTALHTTYSDSGLFTVSCACPPDQVRMQSEAF
jgi:processing peptidase subunit alpha